MAKVAVSDITDLGFTKEMFQKNIDLEFETFISAVITDEAAILEGLIGSTTYASTTSPLPYYVKRAEKCLVAAELIQRRINIILGNVVGTGREIDVTHEAAQKRIYENEAERLISRLGGYADYSGEVLDSSHFGDDDA